MKSYRSAFPRLVAVFLMLSLLLAACNAQLPAASTPGGDTAPVSQAAAVKYHLRTGMNEGKMAFFGVGGDIEGQVNPQLKASPGDTVEITLENGDGILHDIVLPDLNVASEQISEKGKTVTVTFTVDADGTFVYYCSVPGHRQLGMEGQLVVGSGGVAAQADAPSISRAVTDLPAPLNRSTPETVHVDLETTEVVARLADGVTYKFWTFNGKVPGPFIRARVGDTIEVTLKNSLSSENPHSVDFHAATGPGGGASASQTAPGEENTFSFKALNPGLYVYHCATPMVAHHITNGMYGLILVEPEEGLPEVDREFYVMQGELYTEQPYGAAGAHTFSQEKLLGEEAEYFVFNGAVGALTGEGALQANVGETVRIFFGVGGPNFTSSFHVIGEIFDRVYAQGSLTAPPLTDVQTTTVPSGGSVMVEFALQYPGRFILVDHALSRAERGLVGYLMVEGEEDPSIFSGDTSGSSGH